MTKNRDMFERRRAGESVRDLAAAHGISTKRVRKILEREVELDRRALELAEADSRADQPNLLHLEPGTREKVACILQKQEFTPQDVEQYRYGFAVVPFLTIRGFARRDWNNLVKWMARAGKAPVPRRGWRWPIG